MHARWKYNILEIKCYKIIFYKFIQFLSNSSFDLKFWFKIDTQLNLFPILNIKRQNFDVRIFKKEKKIKFL